jgi:hypothetical protein
MLRRGDATEPLPAPGILWEGELAFDVEIVGSFWDAFPPVLSLDLDAAIEEAIGIGFVDPPAWTRASRAATLAFERAATLVFEPSPAGRRLLSKTALSLAIELLRDGRRVQSAMLLVTEEASSTAWDRGDPSRARRVNKVTLNALPLACERPGAARRGWSLVIRGTSLDVERAWGTKERWAGTLEIPLEDALEREAARVGSEGRRFRF